MTGLLRLSGGRRLRSPLGSSTRPTTARVREAVMNMLAPRLQGASWLDLCSGSGVMGCEAIERGVGRVLAVEKDPKTASICRFNLELIAGGVSPTPSFEVIRQDVVSWLKGGRPEGLHPFQMAYLDPPYGSELYEPALQALLEGNWIANQGLVFCEYTHKRNLTPSKQWSVVDQRRYGSTGLLLLSPPKHYLVDTDSTLQQTDPSA